MSCFSAKTKYSLPSWVKAPTQAISNKTMGMMDNKFTPFGGERAAGMTGTQNDAMARLKALLAGGTQPGRVIDDVPGMNGGPAGSTKDYMDPYLEQVMNPIMRNINTMRKQAQMDNDASANMAGAFGDKGSQIARSETDERAFQATEDATGRAYSDAFRSAMGLKTDDINRGMAGKDQMAKLLGQMFGMGGVEQQTNQNALDADFSEFLREQGFDMDQIAKLTAIIGGLPQGTATTKPSTFSSILGGVTGIGSMLMGLPSGGTPTMSGAQGMYF